MAKKSRGRSQVDRIRSRAEKMQPGLFSGITGAVGGMMQQLKKSAQDSLSAMRALLTSNIRWPITRAKDFTTADAAPPGIVGRPVFSDWSTGVAIAEGFKSSHWVYACVDKLMKSAGSVPWKVQALDSKGKWQDEPGHDLELLMAQPNEEMDGQSLIERMTSHLFLGGNSLLTKTLVSQGGRLVPVALWPQNPDGLRPVPGVERLIDHYEWRMFGEVIGLGVEQVIHLMFVDPASPYWGMSPMQAGGRIIDCEIDAVNWWKTSLQNRCVPDGMISYTEPLGKNAYAAARAKLEEKLGSDNARGIFIASGGAKFERFANTPAEMDFTEGRRMTRIEICAMFGVPPPMVGIYDDATLANIKTARKIFWLDTMLPYLSHLASGFNRGLCPFWGRKKGTRQNLIRLVYDVSQVEALQEDLIEKINASKTLFSMGVPVKQINSKMALGLEEFEGWDVGWLPTTLMPTSDALQPVPDPGISEDDPPAASSGKKPGKLPAPQKALGPVTEANWQDRLEQIASARGVQHAEPILPPPSRPGLRRAGLKEIEADWTILSDEWEWDEKDIPELLKAVGINTEPRKAAFWKSFDQNRNGYERQMAGKMGVYFQQLGAEIAGRIVVGDSPLETIRTTIKASRPQLTKILRSSWKDTIRFFGGATVQMLGGRLADGKGTTGGRGKAELAAELEGKADVQIFDPWSDAVQQVVDAFVAEKVTNIDRTTRQRMKAIVSDSFEKGESIDKVAAKIQATTAGMTQRRAYVIARTEIVGASNYASHLVADESGLFATRTWVSSRDERVRDTHKTMDGQSAPMDKLYSNGLMFPGDPSGPAKEVIQCRCVETFEMA